MGNFRILLKGMILSWQKRRLAFRLWAINFIFSFFAVGPLFFLMMKHMSHSFSGERALQKLDLFWLADFVHRFTNITPALLGSALLAAGLYLILSVFLNGGIIGCLNRPEAKTTLADFFHDCGLYFWRFFRLFILSIPVYLAVLGIFYKLIKAFLEIFNRRAPSEWPALIVSNLRLLTLVLLLSMVAMFFDYVKIGLVTGGRKQVLKETWLTLKFFGRRFFKAWGLYLLAGLVFVALTLFYLEIARLIPKNRPLLVLLVFLWQQIYIIGRQWSKVLFFASELEFTRENMGKTG
ncbi:MAG: hypothetical protein L6428_15905 [Candidatus Aminicenantes bacterium]|nr:hypothetical protein [Acidobacteriota bacterium]MCG2812918.1 hypothetical protein [Candidatus Aminicenantes bacterium]